MKAAPLQYQRPASAEDALQALRDLGGMGKLMAGGQTLMPMLNLRLAMLDTVVDISRLNVLRQIEEVTGAVRIGAAVTHAMVEDGAVPDRHAGYLRHVAGGIAYRSVRNRGTVGGSLAHADPAADWPAALLATGADVEIVRDDGTLQRLPLAEFQVGLMETCLGPDDLLAAIVVPMFSPDARWVYRKFCRKVGEFAHSIVAIVHDPDGAGTRCVLGAAAGKPVLLAGVSASLAAGGTSDQAWADVVDADLAAVDEVSAGTYAYQLHRTMVLRAVKELLSS